LISVNNEEDNLIKELRHTSVITKEKLHNPNIDVTVAIEECYVNIYPMEEVEEELSKAKQKVDWSLYEYHYDHNYSDYSFLHDYTK
jgi:hypothetical protein